LSNFASKGDKFVKSFANAMIKMGKVGVFVGKEGEIRKNLQGLQQIKVFNKLDRDDSIEYVFYFTFFLFSLYSLICLKT
jgi:hypothetical protein